MTKVEYLLTKLSEEAGEVIQASCKAQLFGLDSSHPDTQINNAEHLFQETLDLVAVVEMLQDEGVLHKWSEEAEEFQKEAKKLRIEGYMEKKGIV